MSTWLKFSTNQQAVLAVNTIDINMGYPSGSTTTWAIPVQTLDGDFVFAKPPQQHMLNVTGFTEHEYQPDWFPQDEY